MASINKQFDKHCEAVNKIRQLLEEVVGELPATGTGAKLRKQLAAAWSDISESANSIDEMLTSSVQPLPVEFPWKDKEFMAHWSLYKDYLLEQHGIVMGSRMEVSRLKVIKKMCNDDRQLFIQTIDFYMALGSKTIHEFELKTIKNEDGKQEQIVKISGV